MKRKKFFVVAGILFLIIFATMFNFQSSQKKVLRIGIFAGSNWNVPQGEPYSLLDDVIKDFEEQYSDVKVEYVSGIKKEDYAEWLAEKFLTSNEPDIFLLLDEDFNMYASKGALQDLTDFIEGDKDFSAENYYPAAFNYGKFQNKSYALPCESILTFMFVNKTLLAKENISVPKNNWTWRDFLEICSKVTKDTDGDGVFDQFGYYAYSWQHAAVSNGVILFRKDGRASYFATPEMEETLRFMKELHNIFKGYEVTAKDFDMGRVAFRPFTFSEYRTYKPYPWRIKKYSSFEWDCIPLPAGPSGGNISTLNTLLIGMSARSKNKNLAWQLMKKICYDESVQRMILKKSQALPVRRDVITALKSCEIFSWDSADSGVMTTAEISTAMDNSIMPIKFANYDSIMLYADSEIVKIIKGEVPFDNALNKLQKEINALLQN